HVDNVGPVVVAQAPANNLLGPVSSVDVTFSETILGSSFTSADVTFSGPGGAIPITNVQLISGTTYRLSFAAQTASGKYQIALGPDITDLSGNRMDQNANGTAGEPGDQYRGSF